MEGDIDDSCSTMLNRARGEMESKMEKSYIPWTTSGDVVKLLLRLHTLQTKSLLSWAKYLYKYLLFTI